MKQDKILTIIVAGFVGIILAVIIYKITFLVINKGSYQVDKVPIISTNFSLPSKQYFNNNSIDPTPLINIGPNNNSNLFSNSSSN